ncbi:hypothetical protein WOLCODRAFT_162057 [Wolfiporia cocos MD-104 SS10]|uniref:Zn(2)-C6 fungal-type domain-containing protein n=1 Tax=Wolfiporia cocos (strain MD-104) TaxID=742152 RepID=A0A2H3JQM6_WOLCO|nr:hypothetical protein WOLCODRAFT_162057 [Wolfiporia cocos MD-104 SS10]
MQPERNPEQRQSSLPSSLHHALVNAPQEQRTRSGRLGTLEAPEDAEGDPLGPPQPSYAPRASFLPAELSVRPTLTTANFDDANASGSGSSQSHTPPPEDADRRAHARGPRPGAPVLLPPPPVVSEYAGSTDPARYAAAYAHQAPAYSYTYPPPPRMGQWQLGEAGPSTYAQQPYGYGRRQYYSPPRAAYFPVHQPHPHRPHETDPKHTHQTLAIQRIFTNIRYPPHPVALESSRSKVLLPNTAAEQLTQPVQNVGGGVPRASGKGRQTPLMPPTHTLSDEQPTQRFTRIPRCTETAYSSIRIPGIHQGMLLAERSVDLFPRPDLAPCQATLPVQNPLTHADDHPYRSFNPLPPQNWRRDAEAAPVHLPAIEHLPGPHPYMLQGPAQVGGIARSTGVPQPHADPRRRHPWLPPQVSQAPFRSQTIPPHWIAEGSSRGHLDVPTLNPLPPQGQSNVPILSPIPPLGQSDVPAFNPIPPRHEDLEGPEQASFSPLPPQYSIFNPASASRETLSRAPPPSYSEDRPQENSRKRRRRQDSSDLEETSYQVDELPEYSLPSSSTLRRLPTAGASVDEDDDSDHSEYEREKSQEPGADEDPSSVASHGKIFTWTAPPDLVPAQKRRRLRKTEIACDFCRSEWNAACMPIYAVLNYSSSPYWITRLLRTERKLRCDGKRPMCQQCNKRKNVVCQYEAFPRRRGPGKNPEKKSAKKPKEAEKAKEAAASAKAGTQDGSEDPPAAAGEAATVQFPPSTVTLQAEFALQVDPGQINARLVQQYPGRGYYGDHRVPGGARNIELDDEFRALVAGLHPPPARDGDEDEDEAADKSGDAAR